MRCTVLGCGTSTGVPLPGCRCAICTSNDPKNNRMRTSSLIQTDEGKNILIDASPDLRQQALRFDIRKIDAVFFTHTHADHVLGIEDLRAFNFVSKAKIPCYGTKETLNEIKKLFYYIFAENPSYEGGMLPQLNLIEIEHEKPFKIGEIEAVAVTIMHGSTPISGLRISELAYLTDCKTIPERSAKFLLNPKYLLIDGLQFDAHKTHSTIPEAIAHAELLNAKQSYLIHMTHSVDYTAVNTTLPEGIALAYDGLTFEFQ